MWLPKRRSTHRCRRSNWPTSFKFRPRSVSSHRQALENGYGFSRPDRRDCRLPHPTSSFRVQQFANVNRNGLRPRTTTSGAATSSTCRGVTMAYSARIALLVSLGLLAPGCSQETSPLDSIAVQMSGAANRCVADVRDRKVKYESSENCRSLARLAQQYIAAGGLKDSAPSRADRVAESARARAWMALAISKTGDPNLSIW